jgi:hypothetical protein
MNPFDNKERTSGSRIAPKSNRRRSATMPIAKITGSGLAAMGVAVALLWGCLITERVITRDASQERTRIVRELEQLQMERRATPASAPIPHRSLPSPAFLG